MVIASGRSNRQVVAIADHLEERLKQAGHRHVSVEGKQVGDWVLVDSGDIVVHIFRPSRAPSMRWRRCGRWRTRRAQAREGRPPQARLKLTIACIGRAGRGPSAISTSTMPAASAGRSTLRELEEKKKLPPAELIRREGELLLGAVPDKAVLVALDRRGKVLDSEASPSASAAGATTGRRHRLPDRRRRRPRRALLQAASLVLSFGAMTWPHLLARAMLAEQIYRAQQLLAGHPYHRA
jgi:23S rRNA (pseudouridine1915-N3)-methyltransferase